MPLENAQIATIVVSAVALMVSSTALLWSTLQLIHSFLGSAKGYSHINEEVMPGWEQFKHRRFLWGQFRFGVEYDTPVFIVCSVRNKNFPIHGQTPLFIGEPGHDRSEREERERKLGYKRARLNKEGKEIQLVPDPEKTQNGAHTTEKKRSPTQNGVLPDASEKTQKSNSVHTVDNERATWVTLLSALDAMERQSCLWESGQLPGAGPLQSPPDFSKRTLAVAVQRKTRNWDNMPSSITKPYATTTICHIMEMAAMLGLHWKEFDRAQERFLAEGNGFVLKSTSVSELGTVFTFQRRGKNDFEGNRTIPVEEVKDLAFGFVPTIYDANTIYDVRTSADRSRLTALNDDEFEDLKYLQMGSSNELAETFISLGCNTQVSELIRANGTNQRHLYPLAFEVVGMLGKILHVENSFFRTLPNPTFYQWDVRYFNMAQALKIFISEIRKSLPKDHFNEKLSKLLAKAEDIRIALDKQGEMSRNRRIVDAAYLKYLHAALLTCDENLRERQSDARRILPKHIEVVLTCLNPNTLTEDARSKGKECIDAFAALNSAPKDLKEQQLIELYFKHVLPKVRRTESEAELHDSIVDTEIWCTLVFRSLCWLSLHDFHKNDRQPKGKSEMRGSRLPVYII